MAEVKQWQPLPGRKDPGASIERANAADAQAKARRANEEADRTLAGEDRIEGSPREVVEEAAKRAARVSADKDKTIAELSDANDRLEDVILDLKQAKAILEADNARMAEANEKLEEQVAQLQDKLQAAQAGTQS